MRTSRDNEGCQTNCNSLGKVSGRQGFYSMTGMKGPQASCNAVDIKQMIEAIRTLHECGRRIIKKIILNYLMKEKTKSYSTI